MSRRSPSALLKKKQSQLDELAEKFKKALDEEKHTLALQYSRRACRLSPNSEAIYRDSAACLIKLDRWEEAVKEANKSIDIGPPSFVAYDVLSHAQGCLGNWDAVREAGNTALEMRLEEFHREPVIPHELPPVPPAPSKETQENNVIAFSLFGASPKYCETAVLNVNERERLYPHWTCHFYVDDTVPQHVVDRLDVPGSKVFRVSEEQKNTIPGPMWRFFAYDTPNLHRIIFRDADSVVSEREQGAVLEWIESEKHVHIMRDAHSHTELLLAGLWGCIGNTFPPMAKLLEVFLSKPIVSQHFADQYFLREYIWPYAHRSLLQHDSIFGFLNARPFPDGPKLEDFHVGHAEGETMINIECDFPDGTMVDWILREREPEQVICTYSGVCEKGKVETRLPMRLATAVLDDNMFIRVKAA